MKSANLESLEFHPLTPERWGDFEELFGAHGAYSGCWCMWWRSSRKEFEERGGSGNKSAMKEIVKSGAKPGLLAYSEGKAVGWCSVAPREQYSSLERSPVLKRIDDNPVWSIVWLYAAREARGKGITGRLISGAVEYATCGGAAIVEAYPRIGSDKKLPPVSIFMGLEKAYKKAGFKVCARPSETKVIMRYYVKRK